MRGVKFRKNDLLWNIDSNHRESHTISGNVKKSVRTTHCTLEYITEQFHSKKRSMHSKIHLVISLNNELCLNVLYLMVRSLLEYMTQSFNHLSLGTMFNCHGRTISSQLYQLPADPVLCSAPPNSHVRLLSS